MHRSGYIKRGLAVSAISALAVTGVPVLAGTAHAIPLSDQVDEVTLLTGGGEAYANTLSFDDDGTNTTESLIAVAPEGVDSIQFQYRVVGAASDEWQNIGDPVSRNDDGAFTTEWTQPADVDAGDTVELRAVPDTGEDDADTDTADVVTDRPTIELETEGDLGIYANPLNGDGHVAVRGTVSDPGDLNDIAVFDALQDAAGDATPGRVDAIDAVEDDEGNWTWDGVLVYEGNDYEYSEGTEPNQAALTASIDTDEDTEASTYYLQSVATVTAQPARATVATGGTTSATVTVLDDRGEPVAGATVGYLFDDDTTDDTAATDNPNEGTTDADGQVTLTGLGAGTVTAYADTNGTAGWQNADVEADPFTISEYSPELESVEIEADPERTAYDFDELDDTDFTITALDQEGEGLEGEPIQYRWVVDPDGTGANLDTEWTTATDTNADGEVTAEFISSPAAYGVATLPPGTYTLEARRPNVGGTGLTNATPISFQVAESEITFDEGANANAPVNGTITLTGNLALVAAGGAGLGGRTVTITEANVGAGDVAFAPSAQQPAGTTVTGGVATATTDANGNFSVTLRDPAVPPNVDPTPETTVVTAVAGALVGDIGQDDAVNANADSADSITVNFQEDATVESIEIDVDPLFEGAPAPGKPVDLDITVLGEDDNELVDVPVDVSVDRGFLSPDAETPDDLELDDENDDQGDLFGFYEDLGQEERVSTGDEGVEAGIVAAIERDEDFDDDGRVTMTITVEAGGVTETRQVTFDSRNYLNLGEVELVRDGADGNATIGDEVDFNLFARDQFGNLVGDLEATVNDDTPQAEVTTDGDFNRTLTDWATSNAAITATSENVVVQTLTATLEDVSEVTVGADGDPVEGTRTVTADSEPINWVEAEPEPPVKERIVASLRGNNNGGKADRLRVVTGPPAAGATVKLFRFQKGKRKLIRTATLNDNGRKVFRVKDRNGRKFTRYVARVLPTETTRADLSNRRRVR